jgi:hypothetical protein
VLSDTNGTFLGTITIDGYPGTSADGQIFVDDGLKVVITIWVPSLVMGSNHS